MHSKLPPRAARRCKIGSTPYVPVRCGMQATAGGSASIVRCRSAGLLLLLLPALVGADLRPPQLTDTEWTRYATFPSHQQPSWDRRDESGSQISLLMQRAARLHQDGEHERAVADYKRVLKSDPNHAEAYASLSKCLADQGKLDLADKAMQKAIRLNNEKLTAWSLF